MSSFISRIGSKLSSFSKLSKSRHEHRSTGHVLRNFIHEVTLAVYPYARILFPNFRMVHYFYIIFMALLTSVIMFPISSFKFIDILFMLAGSCTQAGLNTINVNDLYLLQQIIIYITTTLTTPIFIHSSLLFVRLYYFERHFDNIKETSKMNFKMRRNATIAARTNTVDNTRLNTVNNQGLGFGNSQVPSQDPNTLVAKASPSSLTSEPKPQDSTEKENGATMYSEPSDEEDSLARVPPDQRQVNVSEGIRFGNLPHPTNRREEIDPSDMFKSIAMLQNRSQVRRDSGGDEDVLVIKSPKEIDRDQSTPIFTKKTQLQFSVSPRKKWLKKLHTGRKNTWTTLRKTISNNPSTAKRRRMSLNSNENESIDSELNDTTDFTNRPSMDGDDMSTTGVLSDDMTRQADPDDENYSDDSEAGSVAVEDSDAERLEKTQSHVLPSAGRPKTKRFNSFDFPNRKTTIAESPTFERMQKAKRRKGRNLRKWRTPAYSRAPSRSNTTENSVGDDEDDDEEHYYGDDESLRRVMSTNYLSWVPTIGRNSTFVRLTDEQKEELGGVEYRAVKLLIKILVFYYLGFHIIAFCMFVGFIQVSPGYADQMRPLGFSPVWWGFFTAQSVFNDLGFTLTPNSMVPFYESVYTLVVASFFIVIGNTGFPVFLRFIIWILFKFAKPLSLFKESLGFLLDHPRRCFTLLFPSMATWWLFIILVVLNATDLILFIVLDLHNPYLSSIPVGFRVLDGLFQAFSTRTAGFAVIDLSQLHPAVQVSYMIMMYISVLPLAISIRRTNVYEEQSLGIYASPTEQEEEKDKETPSNFIGTHLRNQLSFDLWFIFLGLFIICIAEGNQLNENNYRFSVFSIMFEIISAYGTVGLSLGYPGINQSLSYEFSTISKLVMIAMMIRGRHRGLPYSLDRAIMLPDADMQRRDQAQENHAMHRAATLEMHPTRSSHNDVQSTGVAERLEGLRRTITRRASAYRRNSFFPAPARLPEEHELNQMSSQNEVRRSFALG